MANIYMKSYTKNDNTLEITLESLIVIHLLKLCNTRNVTLNVVQQVKNDKDVSLFQINHLNINYKIVQYENVPCITSYCIWPVVVVGNTIMAGLATVCRQIIKSSNDMHYLLGFREACLMTCNESSIWTKFCEVDMISTVKGILKNLKDDFSSPIFHIPKDVLRFETHLEQPVKMHNIYKLARIKHNDKLIKSNVPIDKLNLNHQYAEGPSITLSDLILFSCFHIIFRIFDLGILEKELPLCVLWYQNLLHDLKLAQINFTLPIDLHLPLQKINISRENIKKESLYISDYKRYKPQNRIYTKQGEIEKALTIVNNFQLNLVNNDVPFGHDSYFSWTEVPMEANPLGGALPDKRADRKCHQLENLVKAVLKLNKSRNNVIVDFCSGSGHLGIVIATLIPNSQIILVENKERSLRRARERVLKLHLTNVMLVQSNLDYFVANFDIGVALHACGVATDLVIQMCINSKANFVCCPCCYGAIHNCHHLNYPRSKIFNDTSLTYTDYLVIGHSADQTHDVDNAKTIQGYQCMNIIDTDRKCYAEEHGYTVYLNKLMPLSCTPKNNFLVGVCEN